VAARRALGQGLSSLEPLKLWLILAGGVIGVVLTLAPVLLPKCEPYLPSAAAFGLAWVFHWYYGLLFFLGALIALLLQNANRSSPRSSPCRWHRGWWPEAR
jgi:hypothetical protein